MKIALKAGERLFINGAVLRVERKTNIELMNDAIFLLEAHVLQPEEATTPLRQLYFILQTMIMDPAAADKAIDMYDMVMGSVRSAFSNQHILEHLNEVDALAKSKKWFEAMKIIRGLYPIEAALMFRPKTQEPVSEQAEAPRLAVGQ
ncbi:flagellar protein FlbT [Roseibium hamelinense]|uniref:Flagellar protein FlbT n=1 Tax=Roseibium hamelinense TaxID=150831 RepID=A0A562TIY8_9HYPH|nr:flagellar biosynthesis repressor FlbT [Roseibium hamelinense]MTI45909.1 flagellar biosynthesis repressor FlbT [Roseibium hamelinense]TWI92906.1 flagellar protein FlbT [Roseibium hamelinense]